MGGPPFIFTRLRYGTLQRPHRHRFNAFTGTARRSQEGTPPLRSTARPARSAGRRSETDPSRIPDAPV